MTELFCDICGRTPVRAQILLEGAKLMACSSCARGGKILYRLHEDEEGPIVQTQSVSTPGFDAGEEIIEDCGKIIRAARDRMGLPLSVIAERISERESYLASIENGHVHPSLEVAKKLEKELKVKLIEKIAPSIAASPAASSRFSAPLLGDTITKEKKKKSK